jgi:peptidoglycan/xylan/chitin deacetylase (PgdA/CDA1 family)
MFRRVYRDFLVIFNWHQVTPTFDERVHHPYTWTNLKQFCGQLDYLQTKFNIVSLPAAIKALAEDGLRGPSVAITFDDGDISMETYVAPILRARGLPATFFINTAYIDSDKSYWFPVLNYLKGERSLHGTFRSKLIDEGRSLRHISDPHTYQRVRTEIESFAAVMPGSSPRFVSGEWLGGIDATLFTIGAHGHEHQRYSMMPLDWQRDDLQRNVTILSKYPSYRPLFAVPFGRKVDWTDDTLALAKGEGLTTLLADGGINFPGQTNLARIPADSAHVQALFSDTTAVQS